MFLQVMKSLRFVPSNTCPAVTLWGVKEEAEDSVMKEYKNLHALTCDSDFASLNASKQRKSTLTYNKQEFGIFFD